MDLKNNRITVGELMSNPRVRDLLLREFPMLQDVRMRRRVWNMPLWKILQLGPRYMPQYRINDLLRQVRELD